MVRRQQLGWPLVFAGVLCMVMSLGTTWGVAYGQTSGPTPTPAPPTLSVSVDVDNNTPEPGEQVTFTIVVRNTGDASAQGVVVEAEMPSALQVLSVTTSKGIVTDDGQAAKRFGLAAPLAQPGMGGAASVNSQANQTVVVTIPELAGGESATIKIAARVRDNASGTANVRVTSKAANVNGQLEGTETIVIGGAAAPVPTTAPSATATPRASSQPTTPGASGQPSQLPDTGAANQTQWMLLAIGLSVAAVGVTLVLRTRRA